MKVNHIAALILAVLLAGNANAALIITLEEQGPNLVATASGTLNTTDLTFEGSSISGMTTELHSQYACVGVGSSFTPMQSYTGFSGPTSMGTQYAWYEADSSSGDYLVVWGRDPVWGDESIRVPFGYVSGSSLSGTATWNNKSLSDVGFETGTYVFTWGSGATADTLTVDVVPEPATAGLFAGAFLLTSMYRRLFARL